MNAAPDVVAWDGDWKWDLAAGNSAGEINLWLATADGSL